MKHVIDTSCGDIWTASRTRGGSPQTERTQLHTHALTPRHKKENMQLQRIHTFCMPAAKRPSSFVAVALSVNCCTASVNRSKLRSTAMTQQGTYECTHRLTCKRLSKTWTRVLKQLQVKPPCVYPSKMQISLRLANSKENHMRAVLKYRSSPPAKSSSEEIG